MDSISSGEGSMGATYTLHTWRINDLNFPVSINLLLVLLSFFLSLCLHPSPSWVVSLIGSLALWLILHLYIRGLENYTSSAEKCSIWFRNNSSVKHFSSAFLFLFFHLNWNAVKGYKERNMREESFKNTKRQATTSIASVSTRSCGVLGRVNFAVASWSYVTGRACAPWRIDLRWTGDERGEAERSTRHDRRLIKFDR